MFNIVYKTTNNINGKIYVGVHSVDSLDDSYLGSGIAISAAIKKYGPHSFTREILLTCESAEEAFEIEEILVCDTFIKRKDVYNMRQGGKGLRKGFSYFYDDSNNMYYMETKIALERQDLHARKHTEKDKHKMKILKNDYLSSLSEEEFKQKYCGKSCSEEKRRKIAESQIGVPRRKQTDDEKLQKSLLSLNFWGNYSEDDRKRMCKTRSAESELIRRQKISQSSKKPKKIVICPHCLQEGGANGMTRYHFNNCKQKG